MKILPFKKFTTNTQKNKTMSEDGPMYSWESEEDEIEMASKYIDNIISTTISEFNHRVQELRWYIQNDPKIDYMFLEEEWKEPWEIATMMDKIPQESSIMSSLSYDTAYYIKTLTKFKWKQKCFAKALGTTINNIISSSNPPPKFEKAVYQSFHLYFLQECREYWEDG